MRTTMAIPRSVFAFATAVLLAACSSTPPVQLEATSKSQFDGAVYSGETTQIDKPTPGADAFRAFYQGGSGFISVASVRSTVEEMATQHCERRGMTVRPIQETTSKDPHILGNFPRVELVFECAARSRQAVGSPQVDRLAQLERLKKLLDSGALTQQEFDREKVKILSSQ
jgi:hypothetical protein